MFEKVLIANRGEIAVRVLRTCRELGIRTVVVYSTADRDSMAVRLADEAVHIGPPLARRSYQNAAAIIEAALRTNADAVHPGYGFLSEDPDFAEVCAQHDLTFIGPRPEVMEALGDKARARQIMATAGLPLMPGSLQTVGSVQDADEICAEIGYPVIIKAAAGGGGRGMKIVRTAEKLPAAYRETRRAAQAAFGDSRVYIERYLEQARHVEVQFLCDTHGSGVHLGTRDCSIQRRHQKLVEEAPAPNLSPMVLEVMSEAAVRGALHAGFTGVGTAEFLVDRYERFSFMEVNSRIQVEHPVTELTTGIDLVREQLNVAWGEPLRLRQDQVRSHGVAVECRVNAEDPERDFAPTPGILDTFTVPGGPFTRVDTHAFTGYRIEPYYDSLLAKVVVWGTDREQALNRMDRALREFTVIGPGVATTTGFLRRVVNEKEFRAAEHSTDLVDRLLDGSERDRPAHDRSEPNTKENRS